MTLDEVKNYLRIDFDEDDLFLEELIEVSQIYIESAVGTGYKIDQKAVKLGNILQKKIIAEMYEKRCIAVPNSTKKDTIVSTILDKLSNYGD